MKNAVSTHLNVTAILLLGLFTMAGCDSENHLSVRIRDTIPPLPDSAEFILLQKETPAPTDAIKVGKITYQGSRSGSLGSYRTQDLLAYQMRATALQQGANLVKITRIQPSNRPPSLYVSADLYRVRDIERYNFADVREWCSHPRLSFADFKNPGPPLSLPTTGRSKGNYELGMTAKFYSEKSWIHKKSKDSLELLLHEQGNFDLCEVYCRQYREWILNGNRPEPYINRVYQAWMWKRSDYELQTDHGLDHARQAEWTAKINRALQSATDSSDANFKVK